jgi:hypothetical protein
MVKTKVVTLVALATLATLLAEFVASCTSAEVPSIDDISSRSKITTASKPIAQPSSTPFACLHQIPRLG